MKCGKCDNDNPEDAQHCGTCGILLSSSASSLKGIVSFRDAIKLGLEGYFNFKGRSTRAEYWYWTLFVVLASIAFGVVDRVIGAESLLRTLFGLATLIPGLALGARRLHDINKSGWWQLMWLGAVLVIPMIVIWVWAAKRGSDAENKHGPSLLASD
jgi:uncharacterized membrane protein YhaH (DUF805 family)